MGCSSVCGSSFTIKAGKQLAGWVSADFVDPTARLPRFWCDLHRRSHKYSCTTLGHIACIPVTLVVAMNNSFPFEHILDFVDSDDESDRCTEASSTNLFAGSDASSRTSESISDASMRSVSPTQSVLSVTSTLREDSIADDHGRGINTSSEVYRLPADAAELARLGACPILQALHLRLFIFLVDQQHEMLKVIAGSYSPPTHHVLANEWPEERKAILDLGCGSGRW